MEKDYEDPLIEVEVDVILGDIMEHHSVDKVIKIVLEKHVHLMVVLGFDWIIKVIYFKKLNV